jgi:hypothetical protein
MTSHVPPLNRKLDTGPPTLCDLPTAPPALLTLVAAFSTCAPRMRSCSAKTLYWSASPELALPGGVPLQTKTRVSKNHYS